MATARTGTGRSQLLLVAIAFFGPLLLAVWMYYGGSGLQPSARSNHGVLLEPIRNLADHHPEIRDLAGGSWLMIYVNDGDCLEECREALYRLRQSRLMLGNDMSRVSRVFLHGESPPDRVFLEEQHRGLQSIRNDGLRRTLHLSMPAGTAAGGIFFVDPLGNLVMYFPAELDPKDMVDDIEHLLRLSQIG